MEREDFCRRLTQLRISKGVSARDMSLSIGQSPNYINGIEGGKNYPSMETFFYICDYFGITPKEFFDIESTNPPKVTELIDIVKTFPNEQLDLFIRQNKKWLGTAISYTKPLFCLIYYNNQLIRFSDFIPS